MRTLNTDSGWWSRFPGSCLLGGVLLAGLAACGTDTDAVRNAAAADAQPDVGLRVNTVLGGEADAGFARADTVQSFVFPDDHGPHPAYRSEWWYLTAALENAQGARFGVQFTLFRQGLTPYPLGDNAWQTGQVFLGHLALTDVAAGRHLSDQRLARGHPANAGVVIHPQFNAFIEDWQWTGQATDSGLWQARLQGGTDRSGTGESVPFSVDLQMMQRQPMVLQGNAGLSAKGEGQASYYYSLPRLEMSGNISVDGQSIEVTGKGWLDREWSTSVLGSHLQGWDWAALHLHDGRSLMLFQLRRKDGERDPYDYAIWIDPTHGERKLSAADIAWEPLSFWQDSDGRRWPTHWRIVVGDEQFDLKALVDDQLMDMGLVYWEGLVQINQAEAEVGLGYLEMTGYE